MIFIMAETEEEARSVAEASGLAWIPRGWLHLTWQAQLMGQVAPNVVALPSAKNLRHFEDIEKMLYDREATLWTEMDLLNGKVPR